MHVDLNLRDAMECMNTSSKITVLEKLFIMRELAKLHAFRGQASAGIDLMSLAVVNYTASDDVGSSSKGGSSDSNTGSDLTSPQSSLYCQIGFRLTRDYCSLFGALSMILGVAFRHCCEQSTIVAGMGVVSTSQV